MIVYKEVLSALRDFHFEVEHSLVDSFVSVPAKPETTREENSCVFFSPVVWRPIKVWAKK